MCPKNTNKFYFFCLIYWYKFSTLNWVLVKRLCAIQNDIHNANNWRKYCIYVLLLFLSWLALVLQHVWLLIKLYCIKVQYNKFFISVLMAVCWPSFKNVVISRYTIKYSLLKGFYLIENKEFWITLKNKQH